MSYNPRNTQDRQNLAAKIVATLEGNARFEQLESRSRELVYGASFPHDIKVVVYTSVVYGRNGVKEVRRDGEDAIRVCTVYTRRDGARRGLTSETRINRTGTIAGIIGRLKERIAEAVNGVPLLPTCDCCGAPQFRSRRGNVVCAEACWTLGPAEVATLARHFRAVEVPAAPAPTTTPAPAPAATPDHQGVFDAINTLLAQQGVDQVLPADVLRSLRALGAVEAPAPAQEPAVAVVEPEPTPEPTPAPADPHACRCCGVHVPDFHPVHNTLCIDCEEVS